MLVGMNQSEEEQEFIFTARDQRRLAAALAQAQDIKFFRRLQVVLYLAEGGSLDTAAQFARVDCSTVHRWLHIYERNRCPEDWRDEVRPGRPREAEDLDADLLAEVLAQDPRTRGYRATGWTAPLLTTHLNRECGCPVSARPLRRRLEQYGWRWKRPRYVYAERAPHLGQKKRSIFRSLKQRQPGDVVLFIDWTLLRLFPPLRAAWSPQGEQALVPITGQNAKRVLIGAINQHTGHRGVLIGKRAGGTEVRAFFEELRRRYRPAGRIWLLLDRASAHTNDKTLRLAEELRIELVWLPKQWSELNAMDQLWKELKRLIAANRQATSMEILVQEAADWILTLSPQEALRKAGILSPHFWLKNLLHH